MNCAIHTKNIEIGTSEGEVLYDLESNEEARRAMNYVLCIDPNNAKIYVSKGELNSAMKRGMQ